MYSIDPPRLIFPRRMPDFSFSNISDLDTEKYLPTIEWNQFAILLPATVSLHLLSLFIHGSVLRFLHKRKGRPVNRMIFYQQVRSSLDMTGTGMLMLTFQVCMAICSANLIQIILASHFYPVVDIVGPFVCYLFDFFGGYGLPLILSVSFYTALFRYICIVHAGYLQKKGWSADVSTSIYLVISHFPE